MFDTNENRNAYLDYQNADNSPMSVNSQNASSQYKENKYEKLFDLLPNKPLMSEKQTIQKYFDMIEFARENPIQFLANAATKNNDLMATGNKVLYGGVSKTDYVENSVLNEDETLSNLVFDLAGVDKNYVKKFAKGFVHGINSTGVELGKRTANPLREALGKSPLTDYEISNMYAKIQGLPENSVVYKTGKLTGEIVPYFLLPETKIASLGKWGNRVLTFGYQGSLGSGLNSLIEKGWKPKENLKDKVKNFFDSDESKLNKVYKQKYQKLIDDRKKWEENHPMLSDFQKDLQPHYRSDLTDWELKAKYGLRPPAKEQLKTDVKKLGQDIIPSVGIATALLTDGASLTKNIGAKLTPFMGRKVAQKVASGLVGGGAGTGIAELGRVLFDNESIHDAIKDTLIGTAGGGLLGYGGGRVGRYYAGKNLNKIKNLKDLRNAETKFYKDYIQQMQVKRKDLGTIDFSQAGLETVSKPPEAGIDFPSLKNDIKNAKYLGPEEPLHPRGDDIIKFHRLENNGKEFLIGETKDGKKYYMSKIKDELSDQPSRVGENSPNNIINNVSENFNFKAKNMGEQFVLDSEDKESRGLKGLFSRIKNFGKKNNSESVDKIKNDNRTFYSKDLSDIEKETLKDNPIIDDKIVFGSYNKEEIEQLQNISDTLKKAGYEPSGHAIQRAFQRNIKPERVVEVIKKGRKYKDSEQQIAYYRNNVSVHISKETGRIKTIIYYDKSDTPPLKRNRNAKRKK